MIGPTFESWDTWDKGEYQKKKQKEQSRLISVLEKRFPGFEKAVRYAEVATPRTIERYTMKNGGTVAGPKQMLGQHMFRRLHTRTEWDNFFCCGESTVMGTGTPTVTTSGLSAANALLKKIEKEPYVYQENMKNFVRIVEKPFTADRLYDVYDETARTVMRKAMRCRLCEHPTCTKEKDIRGIMRRVAVGNFEGAKKCWLQNPADRDFLEKYEMTCICAIENKSAVEIQAVIDYLQEVNA